MFLLLDETVSLVLDVLTIEDNAEDKGRELSLCSRPLEKVSGLCN